MCFAVTTTWRPKFFFAPSDLGRFKVLIFVLVGSLIVLNMLLGNLQRGSKLGAKESNFSGDHKMRCSCSVEAVHSCTQEKKSTWKMYLRGTTPALSLHPWKQLRLVGILVEAVQTVATMEHEQIRVDLAKTVHLSDLISEDGYVTKKVDTQ